MTTPLQKMTGLATTLETIRRRLLAECAAKDAEIAHLREREARHAALLGVSDGGRYTNDWTTRAEAMAAEVAALKSEAATARESFVADAVSYLDGRRAVATALNKPERAQAYADAALDFASHLGSGERP